MGAFRYQALNTQGKLIKGTQEGDTERQVRAQLRQQQLKPVSVEKISAGKLSRQSGDKSNDKATSKAKQKSRQLNSGRSGSAKSFSTRLGVKDLSLFTRQLASLVQSGMPLAESLQAVAKQSRKDAIKNIVLQVRSRVLEGLSLAQALGDYPRVFDGMYRAMVNAGEQAGFLGPVLERLSEYAETSHASRQQLKSAMVYPIILVLVCLSIVVGLMVFIVPKITSVFVRAKQELPWATEVLISMSDFLQSNGLYVLIAIILSCFAIQFWLRMPSNMRKWHGVLLRLPIIGHIVVQSDTSRFASTLSMLISSGVPLINSLRISAQTMGNEILREQAEKATVTVEGGTSLHRALDKTEIFPPLMVQMASSGEANGTLAEQLDYSARSQQRELDLQLSTAFNIIEPATIVFMGAVIGFIMIAIIIPIINMSDLA
ncbi:MAG: general secretion pathway protein F [Candidatus Endobugula sp.]|jgi:general secretion pathway protein F